MGISVNQARSLRHGQLVYLIGEWDSDGKPTRARVTGKVQTWKTRPDDFRVPIKRGLYDSGYLTPSNAGRFTLTEPPYRKPVKKLPGSRALRTPRPYYPQYGIR